MHSFLLTVEKTGSKLTLMEERRVVAEENWQESRDMGRQLFTAIQSLLRENGLTPVAVADFRVTTDVSDNFTSVKIAQTVARVYTWAVRLESSSKEQ